MQLSAGESTLITILQAVKSETIDVMADLQGLGKNQTSSGTIKGGPKGLFKIRYQCHFQHLNNTTQT